MKIIYTGYFVDDPQKLLGELPVRLQGDDVIVYAHHVTKEFKPKDGLNGIKLGRAHIFYGFAEVVTDSVQALLVRGEDIEPIFSKPHPHITIATAKDATPVGSNQAIEEAYQAGVIRKLPKEIEIRVTEGYFDGRSVHIGMQGVPGVRAFEGWEDPQNHVRFYFSHSDEEFTTGVMVIPPYTELPKHNRPLAVENLVQVSGRCLIKTFDKNDDGSDAVTEHPLEVGDTLVMPKGQFHVHANPHNEPSATLFKAVGDITAIVNALRQSFTQIEPK